MFQVGKHGKVGWRVLLAADDDYPEEWGEIIWHSPEDPLLYVVLAGEPTSDTDHRHRLAAGDVIFTTSTGGL